MYDLTGFQRDVLVVLAGIGEAKGLTVHEELEAYYDEDLYYGRLYPNLDTLAEQGLIQKSSLDGRTNGYDLTERGRRELRAHQEWVKDVTS